MILLKYLDDESPFKKAYFRDWPDQYDWPFEHQLAAWAVNAINAFRSDVWTLSGQGNLRYQPVVSPSEAREKAKQEALARAAHDDVIAQLRGEARTPSRATPQGGEAPTVPPQG